MKRIDSSLDSVSVLIIAHKRKKFIRQAVSSVLTQLPTMSIVRTTVIKNFSDPDLDDFLKEHNVTNCLSDDEGLGGKIAFGIQESEGDIICFLEDDDIFEHNKIQRVIQVMNDPAVGYYHNSFEVINELGEKIPNPFFLSTRSSDITTDVNGLTMETYNKLVKQGATFNLSCVAIRKSVVIPYIKILDKLDTAIENFLFYITLDSGLRIAIDSQKTTKYRVHNANFSISVNSSMTKFAKEKRIFLEKDLRAYELMLSTISHEAIKQQVRFRLIFPSIALQIVDNSAIKEHSLNKVDALNMAVKNHSFLLATLILISAISRYLPVLGAFIYYRYDKSIYRRTLKRTSKIT